MSTKAPTEGHDKAAHSEPEKPKDAAHPEKTKDAAPKHDEPQKTVEKGAADAHAAVNAAVGEHLHPAPETKPATSASDYTSLPQPPSKNTLLKAGITVAAVVNPVATAAVTIPVATGLWGWNKINKYRPFSWIEKAREKTWNTVKSGVSATWETGTYPLKFVGTAGLNVAKGAATVGKNVVGKSIHFLKDVVEHVPGESKHIVEKVVDGLMAIPGKLTSWGEKIVGGAMGAGKFVFAHPIQTAIGAVLITGLLSNPAVIGSEGIKLIQGFGNIVTGIATRLAP